MEKLWGLLAFIAVLIIVITIGVSSCGKPTPPPGPGPGPAPDPLTDFSVQGKTVRIDGRLKPGAPLSVSEAKRSLQVAADLIDKQ